MRWTANIAKAALLALALALQAGAQTNYGYRLGQQERGEVRFNAQGPSLPIVEIDPDIPTASQDNFTSLIAGRLEANVGANATLGLTLVNDHNGAGNRESFAGNPLKGVRRSLPWRAKSGFITV